MITNYLTRDKSKRSENVSWFYYDSIDLIGFNRTNEKDHYFFSEKIYKKESGKIQLPKSSAIDIDINGKLFSLPFEMRHIANEINHSKYIVQLKMGWDSENAKIIDSNIWETAVIFLIQYSSYIFQEFNGIIETPEINPCIDGSIDMSWRTLKFRLLINIKKSDQKTIAYYYGDQYNNINPIKGNVTTEVITEYLAVWMKSLT